MQAAAKLPEVTSNITFLEQTLARMQTHHDEHAKQDRQRKQAAKQERLQQDLERVRRILMLQVSQGWDGSLCSVVWCGVVCGIRRFRHASKCFPMFPYPRQSSL